MAGNRWESGAVSLTGRRLRGGSYCCSLHHATKEGQCGSQSRSLGDGRLIGSLMLLWHVRRSRAVHALPVFLSHLLSFGMPSIRVYSCCDKRQNKNLHSTLRSVLCLVLDAACGRSAPRVGRRGQHQPSVLERGCTVFAVSTTTMPSQTPSSCGLTLWRFRTGKT